MISSFMRYCIFSSVTTRGWFSTMRSMSVLPSPAFRAAMLFTVGGSWQWSPARMTRDTRRMGIQQAASSACAASSMNSVPNFWPSNSRLALPTSVHAMTRASPNSWALMRISSSVARSFRRSIFWWKASPRPLRLEGELRKSRMALRMAHSSS